MELKLYNTLSRSKEVFRPIDQKRVRMYVCGPTVYDFAHIGNARPVIVFDVLFRLLRHLYGADHVKYVRNVTDVDDKINARAAERGVSIRDLTEETYANFKQDVAALGCLPPTVEPRATEHIEEMKTLIERLVKSGCAYVANDHVLFHVASMKDYGKLSNRSLDEMVAGARVEVAPYKRDPMDFVLWKPSKEGEPGWPSPCGIKTPGRPGWHIECSAMSWKHLGETFDIHGGGIDLVFPHHENELAQSRCAFHSKVMANVWMHNGFLQVEGEKMSKSLGNFVTIADLLHGWKGQAWPGSAIRWAMLQTSYRQPIDWTFELLLRSANEVLEILNLLRGRFRNRGRVDYSSIYAELEDRAPSNTLLNALCDDLNTPQAAAVIRSNKSSTTNELLRCVSDLFFLGVLKESDVKYFSTFHGVASDIRDRQLALSLATNYQVARTNNDGAFASSILGRLNQLGLQVNEQDSSQIVISRKEDTNNFYDSVAILVDARNRARISKNWAESDRIRDELAKMGVVLKDNKDGTTTWEVAR
jgi:cysteinyl-tRNA synthetase